MKFNEKLIKLRKEKGLSQEELGYQFNVTRQTVSKWELGQTTPEMDKLVEMSKFFNVSVDELVNEKETNDSNYNSNDNVVIEDQKVTDKNNNKNKTIVIVVVALLIMFILGVVFVSSVFRNANGLASGIFGSVIEQNQEINEKSSGFFSWIFNMMNKHLEELEENENKNQEFRDKIGNKLEQNLQESDEDKLKKITEKIKDRIAQEAEKLDDSSLTDSEELLVKVKEQLEEKMLNSTFKLYEGIVKGVQVKSLLSEVISNNKKEANLITVNYEGKSASDEKQIKNIITELDLFNEYDVNLEYNGELVNVVNISRL